MSLSWHFASVRGAASIRRQLEVKPTSRPVREALLFVRSSLYPSPPTHMTRSRTCRPKRRRGPRVLFDQPQFEAAESKGAESKGHDHLSGVTKGVPIVSMSADAAHRRAESLFKKEQQLRDAHQAMAEYRA